MSDRRTAARARGRPRAATLAAVASLLATGILARSAPSDAEVRAYVSNESGGSVTVIDLSRDTRIAEIAVGKRPRGIRASSDGRTVYVALSGSPRCPPTIDDAECAAMAVDRTADGIGVIDSRTLRLDRVLAVGTDPEQFDLTADERHLVVANEDAATISVVDIAAGKVERRFGVGREPEGVRILRNSSIALVTNESDDTLAVVDIEGRQPVRFLKVGRRPRDVTVIGADTAYVTNELAGTVSRVSLRSGAIQRTITLGGSARPMGIVLEPRSQRLFVTTGRGGTVAVVDASTDQLIAEVDVGGRPWGIALTPDGRRACAANGPLNEVVCLDTRSHEVKRIPVGRMPSGVAIAAAPRDAQHRGQANITVKSGSTQ